MTKTLNNNWEVKRQGLIFLKGTSSPHDMFVFDMFDMFDLFADNL